MKKNKGFTLIELLAVLIVLVLVFSITLYVYSDYQKQSKTTLSKVEKAELINAGAAYYKEFGDTDGYKLFKDNKNNTYSCVSIKSLVDMGYYKESVKFLSSNLDKDYSVIKIMQDSKGVITYKLIEDYRKNPDECIGTDFSGSISETASVAIDNNNSDIFLKVGLTKSPYGEDSYILSLKIDADVYKENIVNVPVYVLIVMDTSGSMRGSQYTQARNASISLSNSIINNNKIGENTYIGLINFSTSATVRRGFEHAVLYQGHFESASGGTNIDRALNMAYTYMRSQNIASDAMKYVIFLTDGVDSCSKVANDSTGCLATAKNIRNSNTNLIVIGYGVSADNYKIMSSIDETGILCPASNYTDGSGKKHCYYDSNSSNISSLFNNISNSIIETSMSFSKTKVHFDFNDVIQLYDSNGNPVEYLDKEINFKESKNNSLEFKYNVTLDKKQLNCNENTCSVDLFNKGDSYINLYGSNGEIKDTINIKNSPLITISKIETNYLN